MSLASRLVQTAVDHTPLRNWLDGWIRRRGQSRPPMTLGYRQIFILPTRLGWVLGVIMFAMLMGSLNFNNNLGLLTTFIVAGLAHNAMLRAFLNLRGLTIRHCSAAPVFAGQTLVLRVTLGNDARRQRVGLELRQDEQISRFALDYDQNCEVDIEIPTERRGWLSPDKLRLQTSHPLGLFEAWSWFWPEQDVLVWPQPASPAPPLPERAGHQPDRAFTSEPDGDDFFSLRAWREGDSLHLIAWKQSQRHQALLSREFRRELSDHLNLDFEHSPGRDAEARISILTAWVLQAERGRREWTLILPGQTLGPGSGPTHRNDCLRALAEL